MKHHAISGLIYYAIVSACGIYMGVLAVKAYGMFTKMTLGAALRGAGLAP